MDPWHFGDKAGSTIGTDGTSLPSYVFTFKQANLMIYLLLGQVSMNIVITMKKPPLSCDGYCGNFNCDPVDDLIPFLNKTGLAGPIPYGQSLFDDPGYQLPGVTYQAGKNWTTCSASRKQEAERFCAPYRHPGRRESCIYDCCASPDGCQSDGALTPESENQVENQIESTVDSHTEEDEHNKGMGR